MAYSTSRLTTYKRCRLRYHLTYGGEKREVNKTLPLVRGTAAHAAMATFYGGGTVDQALAVAWEEYAPFDPDAEEGMQKLEAILLRYFSWAKENDRWRVVAVEQTFEIEHEGEKLMGIFDLIIQKNGLKFIVDHKFQKSQSFSNLEVDPQVTHYLAIAHLAEMGIRGLIYNIVNLEPGPNRTPAFRQVANRPKPFLKNYLAGLAPQFAEIRLMDQGKLPIYPNFTKDCCWDCVFYRQCVDEIHGKPKPMASGKIEKVEYNEGKSGNLKKGRKKANAKTQPISNLRES